MGIQKLKITAFFCLFWLLTFSSALASAAVEGDACVGSDHRQLASGTWTGFYRYENGSSVDQIIEFNLNGSVLTGSGSDVEVGPFNIKGLYVRSTGKISFVKEYTTHTVQYEGEVTEGTMTGRWSLPNLSGTFQFSAFCKGKVKKTAPSQSGPALLLQ
jgi:hypothetical protein